ncbi:MAG: transposase [Clostridiales bacterium]|nr:transposase [Clostridiales bacterium]
MARKSTNYTDEFKKQIVALKQNGKSTADISREYDIAKSTINKWVKDYNNSSFFKAKDNRTDAENELIRLRKVQYQCNVQSFKYS